MTYRPSTVCLGEARFTAVFMINEIVIKEYQMIRLYSVNRNTGGVIIYMRTEEKL